VKAFGALVVAVALASCRGRASGQDDASGRRAPMVAGSSPTADAAFGHRHAEIKGAIWRSHAGAAPVELAGGHGELDPVQRLWGASATDVYAAAWDDPGHGLLHSKGDGVWSHEPLQERRLFGVWGSSARDVYVANGGVLHNRGDGYWKPEEAHTFVRAFWGTGPHDVWAVGDGGTVMHSTGDGKWTAQSIGKDVLVLAIWGSGPRDIYVAGDDQIFHSIGDGKWAPQILPSTYQVQIHDLWGSGPNDVYAVAAGLFHSTGDGSWTRVAIDGLATAEAVWGNGKELYVGTSSGVFVRRGDAWSQLSARPAGVRALWGVGDDLYIGTEQFTEWTTPE
jgi:hypothetical protein